MKKTNKSNPLKTFNDNKAMAYKKAGGEMAAYKKSLIKANDGRIVGPQTEQQARMSNLMNYQPPVPRANIPGPYGSESRGTQLEQYGINPRSAIKEAVINAETYRATSPSNMRSSMPNTIRGVVGGENKQFTPEQLKTMGIYKKGGPVKRKKK
tara:strand:+ start:216 stop:674 length:459 start_codon:yes stop_codon:yes gene_type:complete